MPTANRSSIDSKERHGRRAARGGVSRADNNSGHTNMNNTNQQQQPQQQQQRAQSAAPPAPKQASPSSSFRFLIARPQAIVIDLLGVLVCKSFMTSSREFRDFFQHNVMDYLSENWKQKQLKIMINFFRCSQANVPDEYKLADREESRDDQIKQAKKHVVWKLRNDPTNSALSLFMLGITEWGYRNKTLRTSVYDEVPTILKHWRDNSKIPVYVGVGSADFLVMVLSNTIYGNILPFFNGHMNIMDFDGTKANKDFKKLVAILRLPPERILYLTRFRQDCRKAMENGLQSLIVLRPDFDSHGLISQLRNKRGAATSIDGTKQQKDAHADEAVSPPGKSFDVKDPEIKKRMETNISTLSLIEDHDDTYNPHSSAIVEQDLNKYNVVLSLTEIAFK